jgi:hypothetical protein
MGQTQQSNQPHNAQEYIFRLGQDLDLYRQSFFGNRKKCPANPLFGEDIPWETQMSHACHMEEWIQAFSASGAAGVVKVQDQSRQTLFVQV